MTNQALVIPPALDERPRVITWEHDHELLPILQRECGGFIDSSPQIHSPAGTFCMWVGDESLLQETIEHNDRAIALCRAGGYDVPDVGGVAVFTGGADEEGNTLTFPAEILAMISAALDPAFMAAHDALTAAGITVVAVEATATHPEENP